MVATGLRPGPERPPQAFNGCIHNVRINGELQDLSYRVASGGRPQGVDSKVQNSCEWAGIKTVQWNFRQENNLKCNMKI